MPDSPGIIGRVWRGIGRLFRPPPEPPRRPPPEPPRPPPSPPPEPPDSPFRDAWDEQASRAVIQESSGRTGYSEQELFQLHTEILVALDTEAPRGVQLAMWDDYIAAFVNGDMRHEDFFNEWNIDPADFSWSLWRAAMGYRTEK